MKERCFLRVHFPCVQHLECGSAEFHYMWNELIFGFRKNYVFTHTVTDKAYQPMENDLFMYVEQEKYVVWDDGVPSLAIIFLIIRKHKIVESATKQFCESVI